MSCLYSHGSLQLPIHVCQWVIRKFALFNISEQSSLLTESDKKPLAGVISPVLAAKYKVHLQIWYIYTVIENQQ